VLAPTDYERAAEGRGARGLVLDDASRVDDVLREAAASARSGRPVYVNARIGRTAFRKGSISL
jgi:acetolactate synthase-1/2/3 large subunit/acetolactate synthase-like protein